LNEIPGVAVVAEGHFQQSRLLGRDDPMRESAVSPMPPFVVLTLARQRVLGAKAGRPAALLRALVQRARA
jgi:hypothetical protein